MTAYEALHSLKTRSKGKWKSMALKMNISKAYDRVEWAHLKAVMQRMRFGERWIGLIMDCITSVSYAVLVNGRPRDVIYPSRGIRQGDPISPYLCLLCVEGLSNLINAAEIKGDIKGMAVARGDIRVSHLLFVDDCIIFARAKWLE
ncbi:hypothetical protein F2P56_003099 [Juglans regia]|uniref:Uncharacterized mitochondrial protein AtMg01250-like n=2 Tax=Juglans regia TaxID=51240 RepID=A0A2I4H1P5_JUGRE|nr:uncharacterized mitochondrial protein AtMg01250-like [Juglans regia]KAF5482541.1 hypothetical protein F2P56_003099 [Juglans regia]